MLAHVAVSIRIRSGWSEDTRLRADSQSVAVPTTVMLSRALRLAARPSRYRRTSTMTRTVIRSGTRSLARTVESLSAFSAQREIPLSRALQTSGLTPSSEPRRPKWTDDRKPRRSRGLVRPRHTSLARRIRADHPPEHPISQEQLQGVRAADTLGGALTSAQAFGDRPAGWPQWPTGWPVPGNWTFEHASANRACVQFMTGAYGPMRRRWGAAYEERGRSVPVRAHAARRKEHPRLLSSMLPAGAKPASHPGVRRLGRRRAYQRGSERRRLPPPPPKPPERSGRGRASLTVRLRPPIW